MLLLVAQVADPLAGGAGWAGVGLLGAILSWLLFIHLPGKDKQVRELIADCDKHNAEIVESFTLQLQQQRADFQEALKFISAQSEKYVTVLAEALRQELKGIQNDRKSP